MAKSENFDTTIRVLVVDDHAMTREMVRAILKGLGFTNVVTAENGRSALDRIRSDSIEFVICDWNMPGFTGLELLKAVRAIEAHKELPFLMLTAEAYRENVSEALKAGVSGYVAKPFTAEMLGERVKDLMKKVKPKPKKK